MEPDQVRLLQETYRLTQENNRILRKMRRQALWGRIIALIVYAALLIAPIWFYMTYLSGTVDKLLQATGVMQKNGQETQSQFDSFKQAWQEFQAKMQNASGSTTPQ